MIRRCRRTARVSCVNVEGPFDIVVTWVDPDDPDWRNAYDRYRRSVPTQDDRSVGFGRYRDLGLLRYAIRAVFRNASWFRTLHLVTAGHTPDWLDLAHPKINLVCHDQIFSDTETLPTFNSVAIESQLHRIPGLSERFLYINDDVLILRQTRSSDFFGGDDGHIVFEDDVSLPHVPHLGHVVDRHLAYSQLLLNRRLTWRDGRRLISHAPQPYDRRWIEFLEKTWPKEWAETSSHRFRQTNDAVLRVLYYHGVQEWPEAERPGWARGLRYPVTVTTEDLYRLITAESGRSETLAAIAAARADPPAFVCFADDWPTGEEDEIVIAALHDWLAAILPDPSPAERTPKAGESRS